jgi:hypothetical protein
LAAWPLAVLAQQPGKIYRIGSLTNDPTIPSQPACYAFLDELREGGFAEGNNVAESRFAEAKPDLYFGASTLRRSSTLLFRENLC